MTAWVVLLAGLGLAITGMTAAVAALTVRRIDLYRWVVQARPGAAAASALLGAPGRLPRAASGLVSAGVLLLGLGLAPLIARWPAAGAVAVVFGLAVPLTVILAYAIPGAVARHWPEAIVRRTARWLDRAAWLLAPLSPGAERLGLAAPSAHSGTEPVDAGELTVLAGVQAFTERPVREVMTPRTEIVAVREGASIREVARTVAESGYSRVPVYHDSLDNIIGIVYAFDLLKLAPGSELPLRPVAVTPPSKPCAELLFELQRERRQFAVVLDEYGGTAGIVTFEDLLEEMVGEIFDEYDLPAGEAGGAGDLVELSGAAPTAEIAARFEVTLPTGAETVSGLLARVAGRIPRAGERYRLAGLEFDVLEAGPTRVQRVLVRRAPVPVIQLRNQHTA